MYNRLLDTFVQVADSKSFAKASEKLFISTVAVMKQINALEKHVGLKLFDRTTTGAALTAAGHSLYNDSQKIIRMSEESIRRAKQVAGNELRTIRIGSSRLHPYTPLQERLSSLAQGTLPVNIKIVPFYEEDIDLLAKIEMLGQAFDCLISPYDDLRWKDKCSIFHLLSLPIRVTLPRSHHLSRRERLTLEDLHGETLMYPSRELLSSFDDLRDQLETEHPGIQLLDVLVYNTDIFNLCVQKNCLMLSYDTWANIHPSLITLPVDWAGESPFGIIYSKNPSKEMLEFLECLR